MNRIAAWMERQSKASVLAICVVLVALVGLLDNLTSVDVSLMTFYWIPVALATWCRGLGAGLGIATLSVATAIAADIIGGHAYRHPLLLVWDVFIRASSFAVFTWMLSLLRATFAELQRHRDHLEEMVAARTAELSTSRDAAEVASRAKSAFLANVTHELRTPLNAVLGFSELLQGEARAQGRSDAADSLGRIHAAGEHLLMLIDDLLEIARFESLTPADLHREPIDVRGLVDEVVEAVRSHADRQGNRIAARVAEGVGVIEADRGRMRRALYHLLENACKFTQDGGVELDAGLEEHEWLVIAVSDTGVGIPADQAQRVFEPFAQADESYSRRYGGIGAGLVIARSFCQLMGGSLALRSEPGQGSTFTMRLPTGSG